MNKKLFLILAITGMFFSSTFCEESEPVSEQTKIDCSNVMQRIVRNQFGTKARLSDFDLACAYKNPPFRAVVPIYLQAFSSWRECVGKNGDCHLCYEQREWLSEVNKAVFKSMEQCAWEKNKK